MATFVGVAASYEYPFSSVSYAATPFSANVAVGELIVVAVLAMQTPLQVYDDTTNVYSLVASVVDSVGNVLSIFKCITTNALTASVDFLQLSFTTSVLGLVLVALDFSTQDGTVDVSASLANLAASTAQSVGPTAAVAQAREILLAVFAGIVAGTSESFSAGSGYTAAATATINDDPTQTRFLNAEYQILTTASGAYSASATLSAAPAEGSALLIAFKDSIVPPSAAVALTSQAAVLAVGATVSPLAAVTLLAAAAVLSVAGALSPLASLSLQAGHAQLNVVASAPPAAAVALQAGHAALGGTFTVTNAIALQAGHAALGTVAFVPPPAGEVYSPAQIDAALHAALRMWQFRYDLLDSSNNLIKTLTTVEHGTITHNASNAIRRTCSLSMIEDPVATLLSQRIRCWAGLTLPDGGVYWWAVGTFLPSTPPRTLVQSQVARVIEGYDLTQALQDNKASTRYPVAAGSLVTNVIAGMLQACGIPTIQQNIVPSGLTVPTPIDWPVGTSFLQMITDMTKLVNYRPIAFDSLGVAQVQPYVLPARRPSTYTYSDDDASVILAGISQGLDLFAVPNVIVLTVSQPDRTYLQSTYTNANPLSPTSTVSRGREIVTVDTSSTAVDLITLNAEAQRKISDASQVYEVVSLPTGLMPFHGDEDVITVVHSGLGVNATYLETGWTMDLKPGGTMVHTLQRIVNV